jgi:hypothetical protein
LYLLQAKSIY